MEGKEVKPGHASTNRTGTPSQGLRILARMITRRLVVQELGVNEQCPSDFNTPFMTGIIEGETKKDTGAQ